MNKKTTQLFSLGDLYVSDFVKEGAQPRGGKENLTLILDEEIGAPRLQRATDLDKMYGQYWYRSGINEAMQAELKNIAHCAVQAIRHQKGDIFLDIACNDGTLLRHVPSDMIKVGVDPADDTYVAESAQIADLIIQDFFSASAYRKCKFGKKKAKIVTIISMFYDIENPLEFLEDVNQIMDDEGLLIIQMSYTPLMLKQLAFDNVCHEHIYYHSLTSMSHLLKRVGMRVVDCELNATNGGSFRIYARKNISSSSLFRTSPERDVGTYRVQSLLSIENDLKITLAEPYKEFYKKILSLRDEVVDYIKTIKGEGKSVWAYGASTKGNTLLQWFGLDDTIIDGIAERSPAKFGLKTVGTNIPIYSEDKMRTVNPDYLLILPWHFINEFKVRESAYLKKGGKFLVPCPRFRVISS